MILRINELFFSGDKVLSSDSSTLSGVTSTSRDSGSSQEVFYNLPDRHAGLISEPPEPPRFRNLRNFENWEPRFFSWAFCVVSVKNTTFFLARHSRYNAELRASVLFRLGPDLAVY